MAPEIDVVTSEVVLNSLLSTAEEMSVALIRSAYSTNIKERRDCSCAVFDPSGRLTALAENIPVHLGSMQGLMTEISKDLARRDLRPGDVIMANDPFLGGGSHLPDVTLIKPVYVRDSLAAFVANIAHWADVGGRVPGGGTAGDSTEIFQEGLRIPPLKIMKGNVLQKDTLFFILSNMRHPEEREGDLRAQLAALRLGERRLHALYKEYGAAEIREVTDALLDYSERWLRRELREIPEGSYSFEDVMDDDGVGDDVLPIKARITISHKKSPAILFDFTGTSPQARGGINMVYQALLATVHYAVKAIIAPDVPVNAGFTRPIRIIAPFGSLVNAGPPAAVGGRTDTCQRVVDTIMGALAEAAPDRVTAASNGATTAIIFAGQERSSGRDFVYVEALGGGMGARSRGDGMDGVQVHITNTSNLPVEALETEYPLRVLRYELVKDTGGAGRFRGGLAIRKDIQALVPVSFSAHADRHRIAPWGIRGGLPGKPGRFSLYTAHGRPQRIRSKVSGVEIKTNGILRALTAGGGGSGPPARRDARAVERDFRNGKVSRAEALKSYGVVLTDAGSVDKKRTASLRRRKRLKK
jgi:N-methylhydantoinase B